jgi:hypothetical protein
MALGREVQTMSDIVWNAGDWSKAFNKASAARDWESLGALRRQVYETTVEAVRARGYELGGERIALDVDASYEALHQGTVLYPETESLTVRHVVQERYRTVVSVHNGRLSRDRTHLRCTRQLACGAQQTHVQSIFMHADTGDCS